MKAVYAIRNIKNEKMYIGSTTNYKSRKADHLKTLKRRKNSSTLIQEDYDIYGKEAFVFFILEELDGLSDNYLEREDYYVLKFNTLAPNGYNKVLPSSKKDSPLLKKIGTENYYKKNAPNNLKSMSPEEWLEKRNLDSNFKTKIPKGIDQKQPLYIIDKNTFEIIKEYSSIQSFIKEGNYHHRHIERTLNINKDKPFVLRSAYGNCIIRKKDYILPLTTPKPEKVKKEKIFIPYSDRNITRIETKLQNLETKEIKIFRSRKDAAEFLNVKRDHVHDLIKGEKNKGGGRISKVTQIKGWVIFQE